MRKIFDEWENTGQDIDLDLFCVCGVSFRMYVPCVPYECPNCHRLYEAKVIVESLEVSDKEDNFTLVGKENPKWD